MIRPWPVLAAGRALVTFDGGDADFDAGEKLSGAKTVTLTEAQLPAHTHGLTRYPTTSGSSSGFTADTSMGGTPAAVTQATASAGSDQAHPNVQPSIAVYAWKRTA